MREAGHNPGTHTPEGMEEKIMKKLIRARMTSDAARKLGYAPAHGGLFIGPVEVDLDAMTPAARWIAEHVTATYVVDEVEDQIPVVARARFSREDEDRRRGTTEERIARLRECYGHYYTDPIEIEITFPIYTGKERAEEIFEEVARQLTQNGARSLYVPGTDEEYDFGMPGMMTNQQFYDCVAEAQIYTDRESYVSDLSLSSMWGDAPDAEIPAGRIEDLIQIWDAAHRTIKDVAKLSGTSVRQLALRYAIPRRTAEDWASGASTPSVHVVLLIQQVEGLLCVQRN